MSDDPDRSDCPERANRRRFLKAIGALGVVGLAGCGGDGDDEDTPTDTETNGPDTETETDTPDTKTDEPDTATDAETTEPSTDTATATPVFGDDPATLVSVSGSPQVAPGDTVTVTGTLNNSYLFEVTNGEFTMEGPEGWTIEALAGTTFDSIASQGEQEVQWDVTAPEDVSGTIELSISGTYKGPEGQESAEVSTTLSIVARVPGQAPIGLDCGGGHFKEMPVIDGLEFLPTADQRADIEFASDNVQPVPEEFRWWPQYVTVDPVPNSGGFGPEEIANTDADTLYRGEWWQTGQYTVEITIENGTYDVILHLAEITYPDSEGARVLSGTVNGETAFEELDITAEVGGNTATTRSVEGLEVTDNTITIEVSSSVENPKLSGIEIREA